MLNGVEQEIFNATSNLVAKELRTGQTLLTDAAASKKEMLQQHISLPKNEETVKELNKYIREKFREFDITTSGLNTVNVSIQYFFD